MKKQTTDFFTTLSREEMETLTSIVNETIAARFTQPVKKSFCAADMWNIQKKRRSFVQRRMA